MSPSSSHDVVIGIPTLNGPERLDRCLRAVKAQTPIERLRAAILVCDDGSREKELEANKTVTAKHGVPLLMNGARLGVAESWNRIVRHAIDTWGVSVIALINDDVEVTQDWLDALVFSVKENPHAGMVGLNAWQGVLSEKFSQPHALAYREATMRHGYGMLASCGFAFAISVEKYLKVGGFDCGYFCFYDELDLGVAFLQREWPSYMLDYPVVLHQGGATTSDPANVDAQKRLQESRARFISKWGRVSFIRSVFRNRKWPECVSWNTGLRVLSD